MSAIDMLEEQHREVEDLFEKYESATGAAKKRGLFEQLANKLAVHAAIEEKHFYPALKTGDTEELLHEAVEEHLQVKRLIADLLALEEVDETFDAKMKVLKEQVEHHVEEEETEMFAEAEDLLDEEILDALEQEMTATQEELLKQEQPALMVKSEIERAAPLT